MTHRVQSLARRAVTLAIVFVLNLSTAGAREFIIVTPLGPIQVDIPHLTPQGSLVRPEAASVASFRPPTIFSAPLPSGSGARALGLAGAFTAVADDATAASWNPGGLTQLERPEGSFVWRASAERDTHHSASDSMSVGHDRFESYGLNYLSGVVPFKLGRHNTVFSLNYQEAYDFTQRFTARFTDRSRRLVRDTAQSTESAAWTDQYILPNGEITLTSHITTKTDRRLDQVLDSGMLTALDFDQEGLIDAITPAFAVELTPKLSAGVSVNFYRDDLFGFHPIRSRTRADFSGTTDSAVTITDRQTTSGTWQYEGILHVPPVGNLPGYDIPVPGGSGSYEPFSDTSTSRDHDRLAFDGTLVEDNRISGLSGLNATFGLLWTLSRLLSLGFTMDLPWTADARQQRTVTETTTTWDAGRTRVVEVTETQQSEDKDIELRFPLYWAAGTVLRFTDEFYVTLDISQTCWSRFSFQAEGEDRLNPLDGTPYGEDPLDDTWAVRAAAEYVLLLAQTEIPLRAGVGWEQRPAVDQPDEIWNFSLGGGLSLGAEPRRVILDVAYIFTCGENALGSLIPGSGMTSDIEEHQVYLSGILHF